MDMTETVNIMNALQQSYDRFPHEPQWLGLTTPTNTGGSIRQRNAVIEVDRIDALARAAEGHHERRAMELNLGSAQYGLSVGTEGFDVVVFFDNEWVLSAKFEGSDTSTLIDTLQVLYHAVDPIVQLSQKKP